MEYREKLLSKNGLATLYLSREFLKYAIGTKIPTVSDLCSKHKIARGTVQNALKLLQSEEAIKIESRGHMGSYLVKKNTTILLKLADINSIVGAMPLPYSKKYEGLASGLIASMENRYDIPVNLAYMRGAKNRIAMVIANRYDFAIVSKYAAKEFLKINSGVKIIKSFGENSYLSEHVLFFHDKNATKIVDGMKVGIDNDSIDQKDLTEIVCANKKVDYIQIEYSQILQRVISGEIDAAVWNKDEVIDKLIPINYKRIENGSKEYSEAVIIVSNEKLELESLLLEVINIETVLSIQKLVVDGKITPSY